MAESKKKPEALKRYVVIPRTNDGYKEMYAVAGPRKIAFGVPEYLTEREIREIKNQKESVRSTGPKNPYELAKEKGVSIDQAMEMLSKMGDAITSASELSWLPKYDIHEA